MPIFMFLADNCPSVGPLANKVKSAHNTIKVHFHVTFYLAHACNACGKCNVFTVSVLLSAHRGWVEAPGMSIG